jgi:hypothetical protein
VIVAAGLAGLVVLPTVVDKHHYAARSLGPRITAGVFVWLAVAVIIWLAVAGFARLEDRFGDTRRLVGGVSGWVLALGVSAIVVTPLELTRHHWAYPQLGPRISASVLIWLTVGYAIRLVLLPIASLRNNRA